MCGSCSETHSARRAEWFWGAVGLAAILTVAAFAIRLQHSDGTQTNAAAVAAAGDCQQAHAAYRNLGSSLTLALANHAGVERPAMLRATVAFRQAVQGSRCAEVTQMRREAKLDTQGFCEPCARALSEPPDRS